jgi:hypothetical protein
LRFEETERGDARATIHGYPIREESESGLWDKGHSRRGDLRQDAPHVWTKLFFSCLLPLFDSFFNVGARLSFLHCRAKVSLNTISHDACIDLVNSALKKGFNITEVCFWMILLVRVAISQM